MSDSDRMPVLCNVVLEGPENDKMNAYMSSACRPLSENNCGNTIRKMHLKRRFSRVIYLILRVFHVLITVPLVVVARVCHYRLNAVYLTLNIMNDGNYKRRRKNSNRIRMNLFTTIDRATLYIYLFVCFRTNAISYSFI